MFVSERTQNRYREALEGIPAGIQRLNALLDSALAGDEQMREAWHVWINAYGEAVRLPELRHTMEQRLQSWYAIIDLALEGVAQPGAAAALPSSWRLDAMLNGLSILAMTSEASLDSHQIRDEIVRTLFPEVTSPASKPARAKHAPVRG